MKDSQFLKKMLDKGLLEVTNSSRAEKLAQEWEAEIQDQEDNLSSIIVDREAPDEDEVEGNMVAGHDIAAEIDLSPSGPRKIGDLSPGLPHESQMPPMD